MKPRLALLLLLPAVLASTGEQQCSSAPAIAGPSNYSRVFGSSTPTGSVLGGLLARSVSERDHAVVDAANRAWVTMAGWENSRLSYLIQPSKGANLVMYLADLDPESTVANKSPITERFFFVIEGQIEIDVNDKEVLVGSNSYAYLPPSSEDYLGQSVSSKNGAKVLVLDRLFAKAEGMPLFRHGDVDTVKPNPSASDSNVVQRNLLPDADEWDFDVIVLDVRPGFSPSAVRSIYTNHAVLLLSGEGIYRLGDNWYPVKAGDAIWAAPFVPQWFAALGPEPARLVLYRDRNVDPLFVA